MKLKTIALAVALACTTMGPARAADWRDVDPAAWSNACQQGAMGDPDPLAAIFRKVVSEARESE